MCINKNQATMTQSEYGDLREQIIINVGNSERHNQLLSSLKDLFRERINSPRKFEMISTIGQLLNILEVRDLLSEDDVEPLKEIAHRLPNSSELLRSLTEYEMSHVEREYVNYYVSESSHNLSSRDREREPNESILNNNIGGMDMNPRKLEKICQTIIEEIGSHWRDLARNLRIRESKIDEIDYDRNLRHANKVTEMLKIHQQKADPQRWFLILCEALESSNRMDLSRELRNIMCMNI